jgi:hypothetical protein
MIMDYRRKSNGWLTFLEHWNLVLVVIVAFAFIKVLDFFTELNGQRWIYFFIASNCLLIIGAGLILYAKLPVYRSGRFFTFGLKSVPPQLAGCYRCGRAVFLFGVVLSLCLLLSRQ